MTKFCNGIPTDQPKLRESKAYAEGRGFVAAGGNPELYDQAETGTVLSDTALVWTAKHAGPTGLSLDMYDPGVAGVAIDASLIDNRIIRVTFQTGPAGATETGDPEDNNSLTFTPKVANKRYGVELVDPLGNDQALAVSVTDDIVTALLATGPGGAITTTGAQLLAACLAEEDVTDILNVAHTTGSSGAGVVVAEGPHMVGYCLSTADDVKTAVAADRDVNNLVAVVDADGSDGSGNMYLDVEQVSFTGSTVPAPLGRDADLWAAGALSWVADPSGVPRDCCADEYGGGHV